MGLWIGFFRGINVGGHNMLPMKELRSALERMGCSSVSTCIQSGNVVFTNKEADADVLQLRIGRMIRSNFGFEPCVLLLTLNQLNAAVAANPFPEGACEPKTLHLFFMGDETSRVDWDSLNAIKNESEQFRMIGRVFYLRAPHGIGRSRLAVKVEKHLGVAVTARNWRTVEKVLQMADRQHSPVETGRPPGPT